MSDKSREGETHTIWERLRRRKVVQWTVAYAVGAWGFQQGLAYVSTLLGWSLRVQRLTGLALLIGLPIALVLAWYQGDRGERRITRTELAIILLLFLVGGGLFWRYGQETEPPASAAVAPSAEAPAAPSATGPTDSRPSIAVLPFENRSRLEDDAFFVDGIHDDILTQLSKVSALKVIARTSVEQFRDTKLPIQEIAAQLGVTSILEGGVQRGGDRVRINVQLIDAGTGAHAWAETYDRELTTENIFAIQSEVAGAIAGALEAALTADEKARVEAVPTRSLDAWEAYQFGRQRMAKRTSAGLAEAERSFRTAIELDPGFALAHAGLADTLSLQVAYSGKPSEATLAEADRAASQALGLDPKLAEAWASRGNIAMGRAQWDEAERFLRRAIDLNPNYAAAHYWLSFAISGEERAQECLEHAERAVQLDPLSPVANGQLGNALVWMGRFDEAAVRYQRVIDVDPTSTVGLKGLANLNAYTRNRVADAVVLLERAVALDGGNPDLQSDHALALLDLDDTSRAERLVAATLKRWPDDMYANVIGLALAAMRGDHASSERHANKALAGYPRNTIALSYLRRADLDRGDPKAARARYASAFPELLGATPPRINVENYQAAVDLALVLERTGEPGRAEALLDASERFMHSLPRLGYYGYGIADVGIHALRGDKEKALAALREAEQAGWRGPGWRHVLSSDLNLDSIRNEPGFAAVLADIERDMARQRASLAARPKDAPLPLGKAPD